MSVDPQLLTAIRLLQDQLMRHNLRGVQATVAPDGMIAVRLRAQALGEFPAPQPGEDVVAWSERTAQVVLAQFAPFRR